MGAASYRMKRSRSSSLPPMARLPCSRKSGEEEEDRSTQEDQEEGRRRGGLAERLVGRPFPSHEEPVGRMASEGLRGLDRVFRYTVQARDERADDEREGDENMSKEHQRPYGKPQGGAACPSKVESHGNRNRRDCQRDEEQRVGPPAATRPEPPHPPCAENPKGDHQESREAGKEQGIEDHLKRRDIQDLLRSGTEQNLEASDRESPRVRF